MDRVAFAVTNHKVPVFLIEIGREEINKKATGGIEIQVALVCGNPIITQGLQDEADAMHLTIGTNGAAIRPARAILTYDIGQEFEIFFAVASQGGKLAIAQVDVGV